jgi:hypothetical protein
MFLSNVQIDSIRRSSDAATCHAQVLEKPVKDLRRSQLGRPVPGKCHEETPPTARRARINVRL